MKECRKRKTVGQDKGEIQNKVKTPKSTIETRTPAAKWEGERKDGCGKVDGQVLITTIKVHEA